MILYVTSEYNYNGKNCFICLVTNIARSMLNVEAHRIWYYNTKIQPVIKSNILHRQCRLRADAEDLPPWWHLEGRGFAGIIHMLKPGQNCQLGFTVYTRL